MIEFIIICILFIGMFLGYQIRSFFVNIDKGQEIQDEFAAIKSKFKKESCDE